MSGRVRLLRKRSGRGVAGDIPALVSSKKRRRTSINVSRELVRHAVEPLAAAPALATEVHAAPAAVADAASASDVTDRAPSESIGADAAVATEFQSRLAEFLRSESEAAFQTWVRCLSAATIFDVFAAQANVAARIFDAWMAFWSEAFQAAPPRSVPRRA